MRNHTYKILHFSSICNSKELEVTQKELRHIPVMEDQTPVGRSEPLYVAGGRKFQESVKKS